MKILPLGQVRNHFCVPFSPELEWHIFVSSSRRVEDSLTHLVALTVLVGGIHLEECVCLRARLSEKKIAIAHSDSLARGQNTRIYAEVEVPMEEL